MCSTFQAELQDSFTMFPAFRMFSAYVAHIFRISGPRTFVLHVVHNCSAYVQHIFRIVFTMLRIFGAFPAPAHLFRICFTLVPHLLQVRARRNALCSASFAHSAYVAHTCAHLKHAFFSISKFLNMTLRFRTLGVAILVLLALPAILA